MGNYRDNYDLPSEKEVEYAYEVAEKLTEPEEEKEIRLARGGRKRQEYGSSNPQPLTGCTIEESDLIRHLIGLKYSGYTQREAFEKAEINPSTATSMMRRNADGVREAKQEHLAVCLEDLQINAKMLICALSEMGSRAVRTLGAVMDDPKEKGFNKVKASVAVLELINVSGAFSNKAKPDDEPAEYLVTLQDNRTEIESGSVHIVDADEVEVLDESDADRNECSAGVC